MNPSENVAVVSPDFGERLTFGLWEPTFATFWNVIGTMGKRAHRGKQVPENAGQPGSSRSPSELIEHGRTHAMRQFAWIDGNADTWSMLRDPESLTAVVHGLAELARQDRPDIVVGIETRGLALGLAVAAQLEIGFAPIRKAGPLFPGNVVIENSDPDYRGNRHELRARRDLVGSGQRAVLIDDWIETGSQARAAAELIERCGSQLVAIAVIVDQSRSSARYRLPPIRSLLTGDQLPASGPA